ncbi:MAG TPA: DUF2267 domain-containing protein [Anaeromyxobacter sp.]|nr:DUF2267 domain-containing protein [Anaeromyxobacter sp.]
MATPPDPQEQADYRALVDALAREGLPRRAEATRAVEAVVCALSQRLSGSDHERLRDLLPDPFRSRLFACERHAVAPHARFDSAEDFYEVVAEDLDRSPDEVEATVRAVFAAIRAQLAEADADDVSSLLPAELEPLWRRPS